MIHNSKQNPFICIFGAPPDNNNLGVGALAHGLVNLIHENRPHASISFLNGRRQPGDYRFSLSDGDLDASIIPYRLSPRSKLQDHMAWIFFLAIAYRLMALKSIRGYLINNNPWIRTLSDADLIGDIRGGDSFSDFYGLKRLIIGSLPCLVAMLLGRRIVYFPQTYGPFQSLPARFIASFLLRRAECVCCRDQASVDLVSSLTKKGEARVPITLCPDVAFALPIHNSSSVQIEPSIEDLDHPLIGINISGLLYAGGYNGKNMFSLKSEYSTMIADLVKHMLINTDAHVLLVPHVLGKDIETDLTACRHLAEALPQEMASRVHLLQGALSAGLAKSVIGRCDFFIGSRMHACIAALSQGVPAIGLAYSDKFQGVFKTVGACDLVIDARIFDTDKICRHCLLLYDLRESIHGQLNDHMPLVLNKVHQTFQELFAQCTSSETHQTPAGQVANNSIA